MLAWLTANPLFPLTCRSAFRNQLSSFEGHRNGLELSQSSSNSALVESGRARVVTKSVLNGEGLRAGRSEARGSEPVKPFPEVFVEAVLP